MAYTKHTIGLLIEVNPTEASRQILEAYRKGKASQRDAAKILGVAESTIIRWVKLLELGDKLEGLKKKALREGWHHENNHLGQGQPVGGWPKKKSRTKKT